MVELTDVKTPAQRSPYLEVNCQARSETLLGQTDSMIRMTIKDIEVTYPIMSEERPRHGPVKPRNTSEIPHQR